MGSFNFLIFFTIATPQFSYIYAPNMVNEFLLEHTRYIESTLSIDAVPMSSFLLTAFFQSNSLKCLL